MTSNSNPPPDSSESPVGSDRSAADGLVNAENEHARIIGLLQQATEAFIRQASPSEVNAILLDLSGYTLSHFRAEEKLMDSIAYPGIETHKQEHEQLAAQVRGLLDVPSKQEALQKAMSVLDIWLDAHLRITDKEFFDFLRRQNQ
jgi:hemerythrin